MAESSPSRLEQLTNELQETRERSRTITKELHSQSLASTLAEAQRTDEFRQLEATHAADVAQLQSLLARANVDKSTLEAELRATKREVQSALQELRRCKEEHFVQNRELRSRVESLAMDNKQLKAMTKSSPFKLRKSKSVAATADMDQAQAEAQQQNDLMKSLLVPMEEELDFYRQRNHELKTELEAAQSTTESSKVEALRKELDSIKAASGDLALEIDVLKTQRSVLQRGCHDLQLELEQERLAHAELKVTWHEANDSFLEIQGTLMEENDRLKRQSDPSAKPAGLPDDEAERLQQLLVKERQQSATNANALRKQLMDLKGQYEQSLSAQRAEWTSRETQLKAIISKQQVELKTYEEHVQQLQQSEMETVSHTSSTSYRASQDLNAEYENQLVQTQEELKAAEQAIIDLHASFDLERQKLQDQALEQSKRHSRHLSRSLESQAALLEQQYLEQQDQVSKLVTDSIACWPRQIESLEDDLATERNQLELFQQQLERTLQAKLNETNRLQTQLEEFEKALAAKAKEANGLSKRLLELEKDRVDALNKQASHTKTIARLRSSTVAVDDQLSQGAEREQQFKRQIEELTSRCETAETKVSALHKDIEQYHFELDSVRENFGEQKELVEDLQLQVSELIDDRQSLQKALEEAEVELADMPPKAAL
eukprot:m.101192 g.101192  ORF g.101192 m.101192 type:complete len:661 (+) comp15161_c0_seq2:112-2094(+)